MRTGAAQGYRGYFHETAFYGSDDEFLAIVTPFLQDGVDAGEPTVSAFAPRNQRLVRDALGDHAIRYITGEAHYLRPAVAIRRYREMLTEYVAAGATQIRVVGDVPHPGVGVPWDWWGRYEAAANHAYGEFPIWGLCPYDTRTAPPSVLDEVRRTHPHIASAQGHVANAAFEDPLAFLTDRGDGGWRDPLERTATAVELTDPSLGQVRTAIAAAGRSTRLGPDDLHGMLLAATEAVSNGTAHGVPPVEVRIWTAPERILVTVADRGTGPNDPFAGLMPTVGSATGGLGLWLAHQLCDYVALEAGAHGFTIRLVAGEVVL